MSFRVFGIPTHVQMGFWFLCMILAWRDVMGPNKFLGLVWIVVVFVSIMVHELGHAFAMMRHGMQPEITLHMFGGMTSAHGMAGLTRAQRVFVSFAGPLAGFVLCALVWGMTLLAPEVTMITSDASAAQLGIAVGVDLLIWVNLYWGILNLIPVLPLDGGHILDDVLGPRRARITATISLVLGAAGLLWALTQTPVRMFIAFIFGSAAMHGWQRLRDIPAPGVARPRKTAPIEEPIPDEIAAQLATARAALAADRFDEAGTAAELVLAGRPPKPAKVAALEILAWAHLLEDRPAEAARAVKAIGRDGEADKALVGAVLLAQGHQEEAREIFEAARAQGDERKEIIGPLIQILIAAGEIPRAAAIALDIVESLSEEDARQMAEIAFERQAYGWSARLSEAVFERTSSPDDAYAGVRSRTLDGDAAGALVLLRRAVAAGFSDAARVWGDEALAALRDGDLDAELEALLPRP